MTEIRIVQIDAFADEIFTGNPAAIMPLEAWLDDETLLAIAAENNLSETGFLVRDARGEADYELRWFTPTDEVAMCGHATLASGHFVLDAGGGERVRFRTRKAGILEVSRDGDGYALDLPATVSAPADRPDLLDALGVEGEVFLADPESAEDTAIVLVRDAAAVRAADPDFRKLGAIHLMAIVTAADDGAEQDVISRVFVPAWGIDEDPVTGSAHAALAPFWAQRLGRTEFRALQASKRGGRLTCEVAGDRVVLGGRCVTVMEGRFLLTD